MKPLAADKVKVRVVNGSGVKNAGSDGARRVHRRRVPVGRARPRTPTAATTRPRSATRPGSSTRATRWPSRWGHSNLVEAASAKNTLGGDVLLIVGRDYDSLKHRFDLIPQPGRHAPPTTHDDPTSTIRTSDDHDHDHDGRAPDRRHPLRARRPEDGRRAGRVSQVVTRIEQSAVAAGVPAPTDHRVRRRRRVDHGRDRGRVRGGREQGREGREGRASTRRCSSRAATTCSSAPIRARSSTPAGEAQHFGSPQQQTGQRSDTIMVAHIDDRTGTALLVSFPRDLWVAIPGIGHAKINAAFNAGPQRVIETIENDFDVPISHYLEVDFAGLPQDGERDRHDPDLLPGAGARREERARDQDRRVPAARTATRRSRTCARATTSRSSTGSGSRIPPPISAASTASSTSCARSRSRRCTPRPAKPWKASSLLDSMLTNLQRDPKLGLSSLRALAYAFHRPGGVETQTLPVNRQFIDGQDALVLDTPRPRRSSPACAASATRRSSPKPSKARRPGDGARRGRERQRPHRARRPGGRRARRPRVLRRWAPATNADRSDYSVTEVRYAPGAPAKAQFLLVGARRRGQGGRARRGARPAGADIVLGARPRLQRPDPPDGEVRRSRRDGAQRAHGAAVGAGCDVRLDRAAVGC